MESSTSCLIVRLSLETTRHFFYLLESCNELSETCIFLATAVEAYDTQLYKDKLSEYPTYLAAFKALTSYTPTNLTTGSLFPAEAEARTLYVTALQDVISGNLTSQEAAQNLADDINDAISNYNDAQ